MKKVFYISIICVILLVGVVFEVHAQLTDPFAGKTLPDILNMIIDDFLSPIAFGIGIIMIVVSGIMYITAGANEEKATKARKALMWTVIGILIFISAKTLVDLIQNTVSNVTTP